MTEPSRERANPKVAFLARILFLSRCSSSVRWFNPAPVATHAEEHLAHDRLYGANAAMSEEKRHMKKKFFLGALVVLVAMIAWVLIINIGARH